MPERGCWGQQRECRGQQKGTAVERMSVGKETIWVEYDPAGDGRGGWEHPDLLLPKLSCSGWHVESGGAGEDWGGVKGRRQCGGKEQREAGRSPSKE